MYPIPNSLVSPVSLSTQTVTLTDNSVKYQIKGMNLRNRNIGDDIVRKLDKTGKLTLYVSWWNI